MNKPCARPECGKIVYPMDELKCLDKVWHKQCFRCGVCNMVLNMKNYKGYQKIPYCEAHYPKTKATVVAETPENRRLAENTKNQSLVKYHEDFEKAKGKKTDIPDDPELQRHMKNTQIISQVAYHGESDRKEHMEKIRPPMEETIAQREYSTPSSNGSTGYAQQNPSPLSASLFNQMSNLRISGSEEFHGSATQSQGRMSSNFLSNHYQVQSQTPQNSRSVGKLEDYDPVHGQFSSIVTGRPIAPSTSPSKSPSAPPNQPQYPAALTTAGFVPAQKSPQHSPAAHNVQQKMPQASQQFSPPAAPQAKKSPTSGTGSVVRAMYDYTAADTDEISFNEGDIIINCTRVDEGWMTGTVQRTGKFGMLPANYVERVH